MVLKNNASGNTKLTPNGSGLMGKLSFFVLLMV